MGGINKLVKPTKYLSGHTGKIYSLKFSSDGMLCASGSHDKLIFLWRISEQNSMILQGHQNAILELHWAQSTEQVISCSPDCSLRIWDTNKGIQLTKFMHKTNVSCCCPLKKGPPLLISGTDDGTVKIWDLRCKRPVSELYHRYPVTTVAFSDSGDTIYTGGLDNTIRVWDLGNKVITKLIGHHDTITGLCISPNGDCLLSNSMDNTLRIWDIRSSPIKAKSYKVLTGHTHSNDKNLLKCDWSPDGLYVSAGSGDKTVCIWNVETRRLLCKLPGHTDSVNEVVFHPTEPIIGSCSSDRQIHIRDLPMHVTLK